MLAAIFKSYKHFYSKKKVSEVDCQLTCFYFLETSKKHRGPEDHEFVPKKVPAILSVEVWFGVHINLFYPEGHLRFHV